MKNITTIRYLLMLPASCIASGLLMLIGSHLGNLIIFPSALLFLATFEFIMPIKSIWLRVLNVLFGFCYIVSYTEGLEAILGSVNNNEFNIGQDILAVFFSMAALAYVLVISFVKDKQDKK